MNERIKAVRKAQGLTMEQFGERIGVGRSNISLIESDKSKPSNSAILMICREFGVDETWLRTGEGEMFRPKTQEEEIEEFLRSVVSGRDDLSDMKKSIILSLKDLPPSFWPEVLNFCRRVAAEYAAAHPPDVHAEAPAAAAAPEPTRTIYRAARSADNHPPQIEQRSVADLDRLAAAETVTSEEDL